MSITFSGLATGLSTDDIVKAIMNVERAPLDRIEATKAQGSKKLEAFAQFKTKLDNLKSAASNLSITSQVRSTKVTLGSEDAFTATTDSGALGSYAISVAQLSQVQKTITDGFSSNTDSILGTGTITINGKTISVTEDNNSLIGLVQSINEWTETTSEGTQTLGVTASIINDGSDTNPYHIVFTGKDANTTFTFVSDLKKADTTPIPINTTNAQTAQQAVVFIDGIKVVSDTNTITNAISGVTLNLNEVSSTSSSGTPQAGVDPWEWTDPPVYNSTLMNVVADTDTVKEKITTFVTAYNGIMEWINSGYEKFGGSSVVPEATEGGEDPILGALLRGNSTVNSVKRSLQSILTQSIDTSGKFHILSELGITTNSNGTLKQNNTVLDTALKENFDDIVYLLSGKDETDGVMKGFNSLLLDLTSGTIGVYALQKKTYDFSVRSFDLQIDQMELRMTKREANLRAQFTIMESLVSSLNAQGDFLTQTIAALNRDR